MSAHVHIKLPIGAKFMGFCPQNDKSTRFNILILLFNTQYFSAAMHTALDLTDFLVRKTSTLRNTLAYYRYRAATTAHLTLCTYLHLVILKKFQFSLFYPVLTCISMETGRRCPARWRIAAAAHNIHVLIWSDRLSIKLFANGQLGLHLNCRAPPSRVATGGLGWAQAHPLSSVAHPMRVGNFPNGCNLLNDTNKRLISL